MWLQRGRCAKVTVHLKSENRTRVRQILRFVPKTMVLMTITIIVEKWDAVLYKGEKIEESSSPTRPQKFVLNENVFEEKIARSFFEA